MEQFAFFKVDRNHLTRAEAAFFNAGFLVDMNHTGFRTRNQKTIAGNCITQRTQTVTVRTTHQPFAAIRRKSSRAIPRFHNRVAIGIEVFIAVRRGSLFRPGFRHHHGFYHRQVTTGTHHQLEHGIKGSGVRRARLDHRLEVINAVGIGIMCHACFVAFHPVDVTAQRVDFAVMGENTERLCQRPTREGVGRIALVIDAEVRNEAAVTQIRIEGIDVLGKEHALVDHRTARHRADVEILDRFGKHGFLDATTDRVKVDLELFFADIIAHADQDLLDFRAGLVGFFTDDRHIDRHLTPAKNAVTLLEDFGFNNRTATFLCRHVDTRQEDLTNSNQAVRSFLVDDFKIGLKEVLRDLKVDTRAITGFAVGINSTAVPDGLERLDPGFDDFATRLTVNRTDKTHAAVGVFFGRIIHPAGFKMSRVLFKTGDIVCALAVNDLVHNSLS